jgi:hypothetical protein
MTSSKFKIQNSKPCLEGVAGSRQSFSRTNTGTFCVVTVLDEIICINTLRG